MAKKTVDAVADQRAKLAAIDAEFKKKGFDPKKHDADSDLAKERRIARAAVRRPEGVD